MELDQESQLGDHGVRKMDYVLGRFTTIDPLWEKYYAWSPYQYSMNNPVSLVDWNGKDVYMLIWLTGDGDFGHAGFAIDRKDGEYDYYDLWPRQRSGVGIKNFDSDVDAGYNAVTKSDLTKIDKYDLDDAILDSKQEHSPEYPDGIIRIPTNSKQESKIKERINEVAFEKVKPYNGADWNCSHYVQDLVQQVITNFMALEYIKEAKRFSVTPHKLFNKGKKIEGAEIVKDPGAQVNKGFVDAYNDEKDK